MCSCVVVDVMEEDFTSKRIDYDAPLESMDPCASLVRSHSSLDPFVLLCLLQEHLTPSMWTSCSRKDCIRDLDLCLAAAHLKLPVVLQESCCSEMCASPAALRTSLLQH